MALGPAVLDRTGMANGAPLPLVSLGIWRLFKPARVRVVAWLLIPTNLDHAKHSPHLHGAVRSIASHHGRSVFGQRHLHLSHVGHAALAHHHVVGNELADSLGKSGVVHANKGWHIVAHGIHGVV